MGVKRPRLSNPLPLDGRGSSDIVAGALPCEPPLLAFLRAKYLRRCSEDGVEGNICSTESLQSGRSCEGDAELPAGSPTACEIKDDTLPETTETVGSAGTCPQVQAGALPTLQQLLPYPIGSLCALEKYLELHCTRLAAQRPLVHPQFLTDTPPTTAVILRAVGYLSAAPLLRCVLMHHALSTRAYDRVLAVMSILRRDVSKLWMKLESLLRETLFDVGSARLTSSAITKHAVLVAAFTIALRRETHENIERLKTSATAPRPALLIVPSQIRVANYGVYLRGFVPKGTRIMGYAGEREEADAYASGYRMESGKGVVIDSLTERCLCSMMNDARFSVFDCNCQFLGSSAHGVRATSKRDIADEELFVGYGAKFRFDLEGVAAGFSRSLAADMSWLAKGTTLPKLNVPAIGGGEAPKR